MQLGIEDPREWLDTVDDDLLTLWDAYYRLEPFGGEFQRHAEMMELTEAIFEHLVNSKIPSEKWHLRYRRRKRRDYFPADYAGERPVVKGKQEKIDKQLEAYAATVINATGK